MATRRPLGHYSAAPPASVARHPEGGQGSEAGEGGDGREARPEAESAESRR
jgi:hypothetical protein